MQKITINKILSKKKITPITCLAAYTKATAQKRIQSNNGKQNLKKKKPKNNKSMETIPKTMNE